MKKMNLFNKNRKTSACLSVVLAFAMILSGCGTKEEKAPELLEPVSTNAAYRPVKRGDIGNLIIKTAAVMPTEYCYYYSSDVDIDKLYVNVGDTVKSGDSLAEADSDSINGDIEELESELSLQQTIKSLNQRIFEQHQKEYDWKIKAYEEANDTKTAAELKIEKNTQAENRRYDNMLFNYRYNKKKADLDERKELKDDTLLACDHAGMVTYVKDISTDKEVEANENVVIVSDDSQPYIEIPGETVKRDAYTVFNNMYTIVDGQKCEIETYDYTNQELAMAQSTNSVPNVRFKLKEDNDKLLKAGQTISLYFSTSEVKDVLLVSNDSIYEENGQSFVYVKTDENEKERRDIIIGASDANSSEVVKGLSEGDLVYYDSDVMVPANYVEYEVALDSYNENASSKNYSMVDTNTVYYKAPCGGYFEEMNVQSGQEVQKGDLLFSIDSGGGSVAVAEIDIQIRDENSAYYETIKEYDAEIKGIEKKISKYKSGKLKERVATPGDANQENTLYMVERLTCQKQVVAYNKQIAAANHNSEIAKLNKEREKLNTNNSGNGVISVYAEQNGVVNNVFVATDVQVEEGANVVSIGTKENMMVLMTVSSKGSSDGDSDSGSVVLKPNQPVKLINIDDSKISFSGHVIGSTADSSRVYISTDEDKNVHITHSSGDDDVRYFILVEDSEFYKNPTGYQIRYAKSTLDNVVMIPNNMIYKEKDKMGGKEKSYVWKIEGDQLVKQYVTLGTVGSNNTCILTGVKAGDVLAKETSEGSSKSKSDED